MWSALVSHALRWQIPRNDDAHMRTVTFLAQWLINYTRLSPSLSLSLSERNDDKATYSPTIKNLFLRDIISSSKYHAHEFPHFIGNSHASLLNSLLSENSLRNKYTKINRFQRINSKLKVTPLGLFYWISLENVTIWTFAGMQFH